MSVAARYAELFATESRDHLTLIEHALIELERSPLAREPIDALFRAVHTLKGMSGVMEYGAVGALAHAMETQLARIRAGDESLTPEHIETLFDAADALSRVVALAVGGQETVLDLAPLIERLTQAVDAPAPLAATNVTMPEGPGIGLRIVLDAETPLPGARAQLILGRLGALGRIVASNPAADDLLQDAFTGSFAVRIVTESTDEQLRRHISLAGYVRRVDVERTRGPSAPGEDARFDDAWNEEALSAPLQRYVRIDLRRLDQLLDLVGELVILRSRLTVLAAAHADVALSDAIAHTGRLIGEVQDGVLGSRMVPVWHVFDRFPRVVRDAARSLGKQIDFVLVGREIELDRALLEQVADPLVHLLRNAIDHGLESPGDRLAAGKPASGRLTLSAARERSAVVITVTDDGRGISRAKVLKRALADNLVDPERDALTDDEVLRLISRPGFSTAERVSEVSGRGVGIDAVVARVRSLGGIVEFTSRPGEGTTFALRLPVTLAIIPALLAEVGDESYALPLTHVTETLQATRGHVSTVRNRSVLVLRNEVMPLLSLRAVVGLPLRNPEGCQIVIVQAADRRAALVVDRLVGQQEIVVKPFDGARGALGCFSGATILPDGAAALILDAGALQ